MINWWRSKVPLAILGSLDVSLAIVGCDVVDPHPLYSLAVVALGCGTTAVAQGEAPSLVAGAIA
jgi:hypothetical protein